MYVKEKKFNSIVALFMCIILLSNFSMSIAYATESSTKGARITLNSGQREGTPQVSTKERTTVISFDSLPSYSNIDFESPYIYFTPEETGVYTVSLTTCDGENLRYLFTADNYMDQSSVRLAGKYINLKQYAVMTSSTPRNNTKVDVVLEAGKQYRIVLEQEFSGNEVVPVVAGTAEDVAATDYLPIIFSVEKHNLKENAYAALNIDVNKITSPNNYLDQFGLERYNDPKLKTYDFSDKDIEEYFLYGKTGDEKDDKGNAIEGILADIVIMVGTIITNVIESILGIHDGTKVSLTIDNIIFNKVDLITIDLTPLGGIKLSSSNDFEGTNIFDNSTVLGIIKTLYDGLKVLAIMVYIVMLLYIGVKILMNTGGKEQRKYTRYLEYWVTGIVILVFVPYFIPAIPQISNAIVSLIGESSYSMQRTITTEEVLARIKKKELLGEDAEIVELNRMIDERIAELDKRIDGQNSDISKEEAENQLMEDLNSFQLPFDLTSSEVFNEGIEEIKSYIDENYDTWSNTNEKEYINLIDNLVRVSVESRTELIDPLKSFLKSALDRYKNAVVKQEIEELQAMKIDLAGDIMVTLKTYAQEQNRLVYAVAWAILLYQAIGLLFMYYKRIFAVIVLILLFPITMAFYVFDKMGDGESQALNTWIKEFFANIFVQVLHAAIYVTIINIGIQVCSMDPARNWFFLLLTVCFLFPGERILRSILGLQASTLGALKNNIMGTAMGGVALYSVARNAWNLGKRGVNVAGDAYKDIKENNGNNIKEKIKDQFYKPEQERLKALNEKKKRRSDLEESKKNARRVRQEKIALGEGNFIDKAHEKLSVAKDAVIGSGIGQGIISAGNAVKNVAHKVASNKVIKGIAKTGRYAYRGGKFVAKKGYGLAKKATGIAIGVAEGAESFGKDGSVGAGISTALNTARSMGGFNYQPKTALRYGETAQIRAQEAQLKKDAATAAKYSSQYSNGTKVGGNMKQITPGNSTRTRASRSPSSRYAAQIRAKINTNTNTKTNTKTNTNTKR